ncbi:pantoate--beta-alanine ligase [Bradyrhizobium sp. WSM471]|uniref:pantoate--beta-alanine ligase n=1 Tax=Bradyrhizobium sp. WSM471 TaxID=319017 RepID=UPI00024D1E48|nr:MULTISPECIES: pantoate--beta-alanine ligase [Bradyrhizobium]EHR01104.1 pantoate--beta-alanine ligase [Bradyrhizobium sp. WSM471]UFW43165.1 pantoate--beta-alanine ligase [Bradyrhizobium canariense]
METITTLAGLRLALAKARKAGRRVGFVPTMGYLHEGHLALVEASRAQSDATVVSIFVNPTQFGPNEDLSTYPRDFLRDERLCRDGGVSIVFAPDPREVYPGGFETFVEPGELSKPLCGAFRPGHFRGVATVVCKLLNMVQPDAVFLGQKDFQQCAVVRRMATDLNFPVEIITVPTVREPDGLAMSSRNRYLNDEQRQRALCISRALFAADAKFRAGEREVDVLVAIARRHLDQVDPLHYVELVDADTLKPAASPLSHPAALCVAAHVGGTRLIDNVVLNPEADAPAPSKTVPELHWLDDRVQDTLTCDRMSMPSS